MKSRINLSERSPPFRSKNASHFFILEFVLQAIYFIKSSPSKHISLVCNNSVVRLFRWGVIVTTIIHIVEVSDLGQIRDTTSSGHLEKRRLECIIIKGVEPSAIIKLVVEQRDSADEGNFPSSGRSNKVTTFSLSFHE